MNFSQIKKQLKTLLESKGVPVAEAFIETEDSAMLHISWGPHHKTLRIADGGNGYFYVELMDAFSYKDEKHVSCDKLLSASSCSNLSVAKRLVGGAEYGVLGIRVRPKDWSELIAEIRDFIASCGIVIERYNHAV